MSLAFVFILKFTSYVIKFPGFLSLGFLHVRLAVEHKKNLSVLEANEARMLQRKPQYRLDATKRKSLSPSNQETIPNGWDVVSVPQKDPTKRRMSEYVLTPPIESTFVHDFFGSQLIIGDMVVCRSLQKTKHRLEISGDRLTVDNIPQTVNQGELEKIKQIIRESRK